jgi:hypothetical protein
MYALMLFMSLNQPNMVSYEVIARYPTESECIKAKVEVVKNNTTKDHRAYECVKIDKE